MVRLCFLLSFLLPPIVFTPNVNAQQQTFLFNINNITLPMNAAGILANVTVGGVSAGMFEGYEFLFSGGFLLSGKAGDTLWVNGVATASRIGDYLAGRVNPQPTDEPGIYVVRRTDPPFGNSWTLWQKAVTLGAAFYDGNNDGQYTPIDLNSNGLWDPNEDAPDLLGDVTAWCVYNDGVPISLRRFPVTPKGIDIHQTLFGYSSSGMRGNILFIRYRLINRGTVAQTLDSVYFSPWADGDLGDYTDDLTGCDTSRQAPFLWNDGPDNLYGANPPSFFIPMLQGPMAYIPGVTFIDLNSNGIYDPGEPALDTARTVRGPLLGTVRYPGAKNLRLSSSIMYIGSDPIRGDPTTMYQARSYMLGRLPNGSILNPCSDPMGSVFGIPCTDINPMYWYSGNPVVPPGYGWIQTVSGDVRYMSNAGPFALRANQPIDLFVAYAIGRGTNQRTSITVARTVTDTARQIFNELDVPTSVDESAQFPHGFSLEQNYPNPFNPRTSFEFRVPSFGLVTLKVFDLLGREVATLMNETKEPGTYEVQFDGSNLSSGVYFARMTSGSFSDTKKLILLR